MFIAGDKLNSNGNMLEKIYIHYTEQELMCALLGQMITLPINENQSFEINYQKVSSSSPP